jgi:hypothetical protein
MPCITQPTLTEQQRQSQRDALKRLQDALGAGVVQIVVGRGGSIALKGWRDEDRSGVSDLCAYRALSNTPEMRRALLKAEAMSGNRMDPRAMASGLHSHDGGASWSRH